MTANPFQKSFQRGIAVQACSYYFAKDRVAAFGLFGLCFLLFSSGSCFDDFSSFWRCLLYLGERRTITADCMDTDCCC